jgi:hypothetical protein
LSAARDPSGRRALCTLVLLALSIARRDTAHAEEVKPSAVEVAGALPSQQPAAQPEQPDQTEQRTDPTEPSRDEPLLALPGNAGAAEHEATAIPGDPWGDVGSAGLLSLRALFQARYASTFAAPSQSARASYAVREDYLAQQNDGFALQRVFLRVGSDPSPYLGFKAVIDLAELIDGDPEDVLKQAYASLRAIPGKLELVVGLFKLPFSVLELDASSRFEFADFGPVNRLVSELGFAGRDLGVQAFWAPLRKAKRLRLSLGSFGSHANGEHDSPFGALAARIESKPNKHVRLGVDWVEHTKRVTYDRPFDTSDKDELPNPPDPLYPAQRRWDKGRALSADVRFKNKGLMVRGEFLYGDRVDRDERYGARTFWAAWGIAAYRIDLPSHVRLLPALRYEWLDADREHEVGVHQTFALALNVLFWERTRFVLELTRREVQADTPLLDQPKPLQLEPYLALDSTRVIAQLQLEL